MKLLNLDVFVFTLSLVLLGEHLLLADFDLKPLPFLVLAHYHLSTLAHIELGHVNVIFGLDSQAGLFIRDLGERTSQRGVLGFELTVRELSLLEDLHE